MYIIKYLILKDLEVGLARVENFQSDQERRNASVKALAVAQAGGGRAGARGEARGRGRHGKRSVRHHDNGRARNQ